MIVLDASVIVEMLLNRPLGAVVRESLALGEEPLAYPERQEDFLMHLALFPVAL